MNRLFKKIYFCFLCLIISFGIRANIVFAESSFWIEYIDVGQGDSALIQCDGHYMMIDGGPSEASSVIYTILKNKDIKKLDYIIATHPDADHIGGLSAALNYSTVDVCYSPTTSHNTKTFASLMKYLSRQNVSITVPKAGDSFALGDALVQIIGPICSDSGSNNNSIVTMVTYGNNSFLFMGDAEAEEEVSILSEYDDLDCDVIKIGHHGSSNSTTSCLIKETSPQYAIISVGKKNQYGHPADEVTNRLIQDNITIYRTDIQGDVLCISDGKNISFETEKNQKTENANTCDYIQSANKDGNVIDTREESYSEIVSTETSYVLNTNTKKYHYPTCSSVSDIKPKNRKDVIAVREEIISGGYAPCKRCNP